MPQMRPTVRPRQRSPMEPICTGPRAGGIAVSLASSSSACIRSSNEVTPSSLCNTSRATPDRSRSRTAASFTTGNRKRWYPPSRPMRASCSIRAARLAVSKLAVSTVRGKTCASIPCPTGPVAWLRHHGGAAISPRPATRKRAWTISCSVDSRTFILNNLPSWILDCHRLSLGLSQGKTNGEQACDRGGPTACPLCLPQPSEM